MTLNTQACWRHSRSTCVFADRDVDGDGEHLERADRQNAALAVQRAVHQQGAGHAVRQHLGERRQVGIALADDAVVVRETSQHGAVAPVQQDGTVLGQLHGLIEILEIEQIEERHRGKPVRAVRLRNRADHQCGPGPVRHAEGNAELQAGVRLVDCCVDRLLHVGWDLDAQQRRGRRVDQPAGSVGDCYSRGLPHHPDSSRHRCTEGVRRTGGGCFAIAEILRHALQDQIHGLQRAAGLFGEHHVESRHLLLGLGQQFRPCVQQLLSRQRQDAEQQQHGQQLQLSADPGWPEGAASDLHRHPRTHSCVFRKMPTIPQTFVAADLAIYALRPPGRYLNVIFALCKALPGAATSPAYAGEETGGYACTISRPCMCGCSPHM